MTETYDIFQAARDGARAAEDGDSGRSLYLIEEVTAAMNELTTAECEWLSVAVSNGAFAKQMNTLPPQDLYVDVKETPAGEIWDI